MAILYIKKLSED